MKIKGIAILLAAFGLLSCTRKTETKEYNEGINVIPAPVEMTVGDGVFSINCATSIYAPDCEDIAAFFADRLSASTGKKVRVGRRSGNIRLVLDPEADVPGEGYLLSVTPKEIRATATDRAGLFYAMQTVMQLLPAEVDSPAKVKNMKWELPCVEIRDYPRFAWRGFHLDPCRHFMSVEDVKKQIDMLSEYKVNTMHWHLTDDQGWRIEIKKYPRLTEVGGYRTEFMGETDGGFYTQEQIAEVVAYAAERFVTIVPEIEMPGHAFAAVLAYPELSCLALPGLKSFSSWGSPDHVFCIGDDHTFEFLEDVVAEVSELFPGVYFHVGGDECTKIKWRSCPKCQKRIADENLYATEDASAVERLQSYAVCRMEKILAKYGKKLVGWDEILEGGLSPDATVMSWRGENGGIAAAKQGHDVVMTPGASGLYLDFYQGDPKAEPVAIGGYTTLEKIYNYNPVPKTLEKLGLQRHIIGVQANNWSEYLYTEEQREYMMYPRMFALAEIGWTPVERKDFEDFSRRVENACARLDYHGINYHIPLPEQPDGSCDHLAFLDSVSVSFATTRPMKMVYTLDGTEPDAQSAEYEAPVSFSESGVISIRTINKSGKMSRVRNIEVEKQTLAPATRIEAPLDRGLDVEMTYGRFAKVEDYRNAPAENERRVLRVSKPSDISALEPHTRDMQNVKFFGSDAYAYVYIPEDGVYRFSTTNDLLYIDDRLVVDNDGEVKRFSRADAEIALATGYHRVHFVFLDNIVGGWTSSRNSCDVLLKGPRDTNFHIARLLVEQEK